MELAHFIPRDFHFLFAPFIALALYKAEINTNYLLAGVKAGLIVLGIIVISQLALDIPRPLEFRPSGVMSSAVFASLAVSMFFVVIVYLNKETFKHKAFTLLSLLSGFITVVLSGTRAAWLTLLLLIVVYLFFLQFDTLSATI